MKKAGAVLLFFLVFNGLSFAQQMPVPSDFLPRTIIVKVKMPLVLIDSQETDFSSLIIKPQDLKILKTYQDSLDLIPFGEKGKGGVVIAESRHKTALWRLPQVLDYFKISKPNRGLKTMVNRSLINPATFLADVTRIEKLEIIKQDATDRMLYSFDKNEQYLNIVTKTD